MPLKKTYDNEPKLISNKFDPAEISKKEEIAEMLWKSLEILPEHERLTIVLCVYEGKKYREAAQICNCSIKTVSSRFSRAVKKLRKYFKVNFDHEL